jgi:broad specificity phosphatase PhoE
LQTAQLAFPGQPIREDPRLKEVHFGAFEGHTLDERLALSSWRTWSQNAFLERAPGGESYAELRARAVAWLESLPDAPQIVAVTHSGTIQMLLSHILGVEHPRWRKRFFLKYTGVTCLLFEGSEVLIERVNDFGHLDAFMNVADEREAEDAAREP